MERIKDTLPLIAVVVLVLLAAVALVWLTRAFPPQPPAPFPTAVAR